MANRFTNITPSDFTPLSVNEIMMVPLAKQQQHEIAQQQAMQLAGADVNRLEVDDPIVNAEITKLRTAQTEIEDELMTSGIGKGINKKLLSLKRNRDMFLSNDGIGGKAQANYNLYQKNVKDILSNKNLSQTQKNLGLKYALNQYNNTGGIAQNGVYNPYIGSYYVDLTDRAINLAKNMKPKEVTRISGWKRNTNGTWTNGTRTTEKLPPEVIKKVIISAFANDDSVVNYLKDMQQIGAMENPLSYVDGISNTIANAFQVDNVSSKQDMKFEPGFFTKDGSLSSGPVWDYDPVKNRPVFKNSLIDKLSDISKGAVYEKTGLPRMDASGMNMGLQMTQGTQSTNEISSFETRLNEEEREEVMNLYDKIINSGYKGITIDPTRTEQEIAGIVAGYMAENKDFVFRDAHVYTNMSAGPIDSSFFINSKDSKSQSEALSDMVMLGKSRVWSKDGKLIDVEDLSDAEIKYLGHVSPDNGIQSLEQANENAMVMPYLAKVTPKNGGVPQEVYVERAEYDMEAPAKRAAFQASKIIKRATSTATSEPGLLNEIQLENSPLFDTLNVYYYRAGITNEDEIFRIHFSGKNGKTEERFYNRQQFKNALYKAYGVKPE